MPGVANVRACAEDKGPTVVPRHAVAVVHPIF